MEASVGWWNSVVADDFDGDGDIDLIAGNWGLNSRLKASVEEPVTLYRSDFDGNGSVETVISYFYYGQETTLATKDELVRQLPVLNKKFLSYRDFARASLDELFGEEALNSAAKQVVTELASCYFENTGNNKFRKRVMQSAAQVAPVHDMLIEDFNHDGAVDLLLVGNSFEISTQLGRQDALTGRLLLNNGLGEFTTGSLPMPVNGAARDIEKINIDGKPLLIITRNNREPFIINSNWE